jgi:hypothetical protein
MSIALGRHTHGLETKFGSHAVAENTRARAIHKSELLIVPDGFNDLFFGHPNPGATAYSLPVGLALDSEAVERFVDGAHEAAHLFDGVSGRRGDTEALFADGNGRVVDGLDVDSVVDEKRVRGSLGQSGVTNKNWDDMGRTRARGAR